MGSKYTKVLDSLHTHSLEELFNTGIYTIKSKTNGKYYIGRASRVNRGNVGLGFRERWRDHVRKLIKGNHYNIYLQRHVNKYGIEDLEFKILDYYDPEFCPSAELYWIRMLDTVQYGFNCVYEDNNLRFGKHSSAYKQLNDEEIIDKYINTNISIKDLVKEYNTSDGKIYRILNTHNIKIINKNNSKYRINYIKLYNEYINNKIGIPQLAKKYKIDKNTIITHFRLNNLKLKREIFKDDINIIYKRYLNGENILNIADEYKIDSTSVYNYFTECNLKNKFKLVKQDINKIYLRYIKGESITLDIIPEYGVSRDVIYRLFRKYNMKLKI